MEKVTKEPLSVAEWGAALVALLLAIASGATPFTVSTTFVEMFRDFGSISELPPLTQLVLERSFGLTHATMTSGVIVTAFLSSRKVLLRRVLIIVGCAFGLLGVGIYIYGVYSPLFHIADAVGP